FSIYALRIYTKNRERYVDTTKLYKDVKDYMNFYDYSYDLTGTTKLHYPLPVYQISYVSYNVYQIRIFCNFITGRLSAHEAVLLGIAYNNYDFAGLTTPTDIETYKKYGRIIGNISNDMSRQNIWESKVEITRDSKSRAYS